MQVTCNHLSPWAFVPIFWWIFCFNCRYQNAQTVFELGCKPSQNRNWFFSWNGLHPCNNWNVLLIRFLVNIGAKILMTKFSIQLHSDQLVTKFQKSDVGSKMFRRGYRLKNFKCKSTWSLCNGLGASIEWSRRASYSQYIGSIASSFTANEIVINPSYYIGISFLYKSLANWAFWAKLRFKKFHLLGSKMLTNWELNLIHIQYQDVFLSL